MKTITTLSGSIINVDQIAMITVAGRYQDDPPENSALVIHFPAALSTTKGSRSMRIVLLRDEAIAFLASLAQLGVNVMPTLKALEESIIDAEEA